MEKTDISALETRPRSMFWGHGDLQPLSWAQAANPVSVQMCAKHASAKGSDRISIGMVGQEGFGTRDSCSPVQPQQGLPFLRAACAAAFASHAELSRAGVSSHCTSSLTLSRCLCMSLAIFLFFVRFLIPVPEQYDHFFPEAIAAEASSTCPTAVAFTPHRSSRVAPPPVGTVGSHSICSSQPRSRTHCLQWLG